MQFDLPAYTKILTSYVNAPYDMVVVRTGKFNIIVAIFQGCIHRGDQYDCGCT